MIRCAIRSRWKQSVYPYGLLFSEFFIKQYGQDKFLDLYGLTSSKKGELKNKLTGSEVMKEGQLMVSESELMEAALVEMEIDVGDLKGQFRSYVQEIASK